MPNISHHHPTNALDLDTCFTQNLLQPPPDFTAQVMQHLASEPLPFAAAMSAKRWEWLQWLALLGGALLSLEQLVSYIFGVWLVTSIG